MESSDLILSIEDALVILGGKPFFEDLTFHIHAGRKIALVGRNGAGKTTLMNLITGDREIDDGLRWEKQGITVGYMQQQVDPKPGQTVHDFVFESMSSTIEDWDRTYRIEMIVQPLGLAPEDRLDSLSGGLLRRAALARALVEGPDILLLDEPTNHLDLETIEWLENYLHFYKGAVLCVSHDRAFLSRITDRVFWLDRGKLKVSPYGFSRFAEWSQDLLDQEGRALHNREKKVEQEMEWANRGVKARVKRNVRRVALAHEAHAQLEADKKSYRRATRRIKLEAPEADETSQKIAEFVNASKTFTDPDTGRERHILKKYNLLIRRRDRVGILGKNGSGKTSFLKLLLGELAPDSGTVKRAADIEFGYFDQGRVALDPDKTLQENLCPIGSDHLDVRGKQRHICGYIKDFLFEPEDAWRPARTLSGGQMNRLMLAKVLAAPGNFLILDEPTNDLDMDTLDMLEDILAAYEGTLFVVSHDRDFLDQVVDRLMVFEGDGRIETIMGGYSDYLLYRKKQQGGEEKEAAPAARAAVPERPKVRQAAPMTYKLRYELEQLPAQIRALEAERDELENNVADPELYTRDPDLFMKSARRLEAVRGEIERTETRWLELEAMRDGAAG